MATHRGFPKAVHTARLLASIGDPLRFPGRVCSDPGKHHLPEDYQGETCPVAVYGEKGDELRACGAPVGPLRRGTGTRALWHYAGLHVVDGRMPRQTRGQQGDWNPAVRDALLKPDVGLAAQLIRQRVEPWRGVYDEAKERITRERGVEAMDEIEGADGFALLHGDGEGAAETSSEIDETPGRSFLDWLEPDGGGVDRAPEIVGRDGSAALRPIDVERRARVIAVKAMLGDLLSEWKRIVRAE